MPPPMGGAPTPGGPPPGAMPPPPMMGGPPPGPPAGAQPMGNNVVPFPPPGGGASPLMGGMPPGMVPNPAYAAWQKQAAQVQAIVQQNADCQSKFDAAYAMIRKDGIHGFRLDIEADSTIAPDEQAEKQARVEFLQQMVPMLQQVVPFAQGNPPLASLAKEMTLFAARGFRVARPLEESIEKAFDALAGMPPNPKASGQDQKGGAAAPNPQIEMARIQAETHGDDASAQTQRMAIAQKAQQGQQELALEAQKAQAEDVRSQADQAMAAAEFGQRERLSQARVTSLDSRMAGRLV